MDCKEATADAISMVLFFFLASQKRPKLGGLGRPTCGLEERSVDARISIMRSSSLMRQSSAWARNPSAEDNPP